jgi:hypothetical protein
MTAFFGRRPRSGKATVRLGGSRVKLAWMIAEIRHWLELRRLQADRWKTIRRFDALIKKAESAGQSRQDVESLLSAAVEERSIADVLITEAHGRYLIEQAERYIIPLPLFDEDSGDWVSSDFTRDRWTLSPKAIVTLRTAVRAEQKERRDYWRGLLTACTGALGALIGLLAFLDKVLRTAP